MTSSYLSGDNPYSVSATNFNTDYNHYQPSFSDATDLSPVGSTGSVLPYFSRVSSAELQQPEPRRAGKVGVAHLEYDLRDATPSPRPTASGDGGWITYAGIASRASVYTPLQPDGSYVPSSSQQNDPSYLAGFTAENWPVMKPIRRKPVPKPMQLTTSISQYPSNTATSAPSPSRFTGATFTPRHSLSEPDLPGLVQDPMDDRSSRWGSIRDWASSHLSRMWSGNEGLTSSFRKVASSF